MKSGFVRRRLVSSSSENKETPSGSGWLVEEYNYGENEFHDQNGHNDDHHELAKECDEGLTLAEEVLLLEYQNILGNEVSFRNSMDAAVLPCCILIELELRGRIESESTIESDEYWVRRNVVLKNADKTGDEILDEVLNRIQDNPTPLSPGTWLNYLCGMPREIERPRERVANDLLKKRMQSIGSSPFIPPEYSLIEAIVHPFNMVIKKIQDYLLSDWMDNPQRIDARVLSLVMMAHFGNVMDVPLKSLSEDDTKLAKERLNVLLKLDMKAEAEKSNSNHIMWTLFHLFRDFESHVMEKII